MIKRILLLGIIAHNSQLSVSSAGGGSVVKGLPAATGRRLLSGPWSSVSLGFDRVGSVTLGRGTGNLHFSLLSTLLFWVIISKFEIKNPTDPTKSADFA